MRAMIISKCLVGCLVCVSAPKLLGAPPLMEAITYQGQLKEGGVPATGEYDFQFKLFNAYSFGSQVSVTISRSNVDVANGLFIVGLDWPADVFDGSDLWLQVELRPGDSTGTYTVLSPRGPLTGVPYAIHSRSAANLKLPYAGTASTSGNAFSVTNTGNGVAAAFQIDNASGNSPVIWVDTNSQHHGIVARTTGTGSAGSFSISNAANTANALTGSSNGSGISIYGQQLGTGRAGFFLCQDGSNDSDAVEVKTHGTGRAGHFHIVNPANTATALRATTDGGGQALQAMTTGNGRAAEAIIMNDTSTSAAVFAQTSGARGKAVHGLAIADGSTKNYGGFFHAKGKSGRGVYAKSDGSSGRAVEAEATGGSSYAVHGVSDTGTGVYGEASASSGTTYGVRGSAPSPAGYAGYFGGRGYFSGMLGIGELDPDQQLHVDGNAKVTGWIGTDEDATVTFKTSDRTALRLEPAESEWGGFSPNIIGGYGGNYVAPGEVGAVIGGGGYQDPAVGDHVNRVVASFGVVGGGYNNEAGIGSTVGGGIGNTAGNDNLAVDPLAQWATVGGGQGNDAMNFCATVGGGVHNRANGDTSTIAGGDANITGDADNPPYWNWGRWATVGGGSSNNAQATGSTIPGGAYGYARIPYQLAYAAGAFRAARGSAQTSIYVLRQLTYNVGSYVLSGGSAPLTIHDGQTWSFDVLITARAEDGTSAGYQITGVVKRAGAATTFIGTPTVRTLGEDSAASSWGVHLSINDFFEDHRLEIRVTGAEDTEIRWVATVRTTEVAW